jgi:trans-2-enoyl-CoA reductase
MSKELIEQLAKDSPILSQYLNGDVFYEEMYLNALEAFAKAYQAATPIDKVAEALEKAAIVCENNMMSWADDVWNNAVKDCAKRVRALIPDTQANTIDAAREQP